MSELKNAFGYIPELPEEVRRSCVYICQELASISDKWNLYLGLFSSKETVAILNDTAPRAFQTIEESLRVDIAMSICRLADPTISFGFENLSVEMLLRNLPDVEALNDEISNFKTLSQPLIDLRNKRFAHNDKNSMLYPLDNPFPEIGQDAIKSIINSLSSIINKISSHYKGPELDFVLPISAAEDLLYWIKIGHLKDHEDMEALRRRYNLNES